jgi:tRNA isopentenyl-2-thiomethyl-A-37 hydroxylase MiaE
MTHEYCITCQKRATMTCTCCHSTFYCSTLCQQYDYTHIHRYEREFYAASANSGVRLAAGADSGEAAATFEEVTRTGASEAKRQVNEDRELKRELRATLVAVEQQLKEMATTTLASEEKQLDLDRMDDREKRAFLHLFDVDPAVELRVEEQNRVQFMEKLDELAALLTKYIHASDGGVRSLRTVANSPLLQRRLARYFRMKAIMVEKKKLAFLTNAQPDLDDAVAWERRVEEDNQAFVHEWLFADDFDFATNQVLRKRLETQQLQENFVETFIDDIVRDSNQLYVDYLQRQEAASARLSSRTFGSLVDNLGGDDESQHTAQDAQIGFLAQLVQDSGDNWEHIKLTCSNYAKEALERILIVLSLKRDAGDITNETMVTTSSLLKRLRDTYESVSTEVLTELEREEREQQQDEEEEEEEKQGGYPRLRGIARAIRKKWEAFKRTVSHPRISYLLGWAMFITSLTVLASGYLSYNLSTESDITTLKESITQLSGNLASDDKNLGNLAQMTRKLDEKFTELASDLKQPSVTVKSISANAFGGAVQEACINTEVNVLIDDFRKALISTPNMATRQHEFFSSFIQDELNPFLATSNITHKRAYLEQIQTTLQSLEVATASQAMARDKVSDMLARFRELTQESIPSLDKLQEANVNTKKLLEQMFLTVQSAQEKVARLEIGSPTVYSIARLIGEENALDRSTADLLTNTEMQSQSWRWVRATITGPVLQHAGQMEFRFRKLFRETCAYFGSAFEWGAPTLRLLYEWTLGKYDIFTSCYFFTSSMQTLLSTMDRGLAIGETLLRFMPGPLCEALNALLYNNEVLTEEDDAVEQIVETIRVVSNGTPEDQQRRLERQRRLDQTHKISYRVYFKAMLKIGDTGGEYEGLVPNETRAGFGAYRYWLRDVGNDRLRPVTELLRYYAYVKLSWQMASFMGRVCSFVAYLSSYPIGIVLGAAWGLYIVSGYLTQRGSVEPMALRVSGPIIAMLSFYARHPVITPVIMTVLEYTTYSFFAIDDSVNYFSRFLPTNTTPVEEIAGNQTFLADYWSPFLLTPDDALGVRELQAAQKDFSHIASNYTRVLGETSIAGLGNNLTALTAEYDNILLFAKGVTVATKIDLFSTT